MAKKKAGKSFSQSIREHLQANPNATPNQIVEALAKTGVNVSVGLASNVKYTSGPGAKNKTAKKKRATGGKKATVTRKLPSAQAVDISALQAAAKFVAQVGDADQAIAAVTNLGNWKIVREKPKKAWQLYDLARDAAESKNLAAERPADVARLNAEFRAWLAAVKRKVRKSGVK